MALEDLAKFEWAALSERLAESKERLPLALNALKTHYAQFGMEDDYIINSAFTRAKEGLPKGHISDAGILDAIEGYSNSYQTALEETSVADIMQSAVNKGYELPGEFKEFVKGYEAFTLKKLVEKAKQDKDEKAAKVLLGINLMENYKFEAGLYPQLLKATTDAGLRQLAENKDGNKKKK